MDEKSRKERKKEEEKESERKKDVKFLLHSKPKKSCDDELFIAIEEHEGMKNE